MKTARLVHPGFWFGKTPLAEALQLAKLGVGGFCLYGGTRQEVADFTAAVRAASPLPYLLISADYEDGLGRWLPDAPLLPSNMALGAAGDENLAFEKGFLTAQQARSLGVDWVFAPVLDLADNPLNPIVNTRSFGDDPQQVIRLGRAFLKGLKQGGALNSLKHFPGHGDTTTDSHLALPVLHKTKEQLLNREILPFQTLLPLADSVMLGHLLLPEIDPNNPASLSEPIIRRLLRQELKYDGCILTDALLMKAIGDEKQAARQALQAGADLLLVPQNPLELISFLEEKQLPPEILSRALARQDRLCQQAQAAQKPSQAQAFMPNDLNRRTAQKAIVATGKSIVIKPGQTIHYLEIGNEGNYSSKPFLETLAKHQIQALAYNGTKVHTLVVLCFRRYQAFQGKIVLEETDTARLQQALQDADQSICVLFSSPWALPQHITAQTTLFTFCPAAQFQETAAKILLGKQKACGKLPFTL
ncbi:MAG: hypothetical protein IKO35_01115 [Elusimicrobiaceae bacterium]|nr:hypothetical protein [Elusimicrobiaceae bacterium]